MWYDNHMVVALLILVGLALGSFVNAFIWRIHKGRNWVSERSECTHCHHVLGPLDLVPVVSYLFLRGKCRYCHKPIQDSPLTELLVPSLFVISYYFWPISLSGVGLFVFVLWLAFLVGFVILTIYDLKWMLLPDIVVYPLISLAVAGVLVVWLCFGGSSEAALGAVSGAAIISGIFYVLYKLSKGRWIGFGDVKLGIVLGLLSGSALSSLLVLFIASIIGMLIALPLMLFGKANRKTQLPFGPLLIIGLFVTVLFGTQIINWYLRLLFPM